MSEIDYSSSSIVTARTPGSGAPFRNIRPNRGTLRRGASCDITRSRHPDASLARTTGVAVLGCTSVGNGTVRAAR
jgi:hypothetical protein